jgi:peptidyl-prolyl cis-trans isomerase D
MLNTLRNAAGTWVAKFLLLLLVLSFAVWGISGQLHNIGASNSVVTAGGTSASVQDYRLAYDRQLSVLSQRFGQRLTREQARALGVEDQVLAQLVAGVVLDEQARLMGLGLSRDRIAELTAEDPAFHGPDGRFNRQQFEYVLRQVGMRAEDYLTNRAQVAVRQQIVEAVSDGLKAPDAFYNALSLYNGETRTVDYLILAKSLVEPIDPPGDAALSTWFDENKKTYAAPEYRKIAYVRLEAEDIADASSVSDEQVRADYEKNKARFTTPETRTIEQLVFPSKEAAQQAADSIRTGTTFDQIVAAQGKTIADIQLGTLAKDKVSDPALATAAFALAANQVSDVIEGAFGPVLVRVTAINPEVVKSYEEVASDIRKDLALGEAHRVLLDVHDSYEDARAGGSTLAEAADKLKLKVTTIDAMDRSGRRPDETVVNDIPASAQLLQTAFESEVGVENDGLQTGKDGYVFFEVQGITPARDRTLDEVKDRVLADWTAQETAKRLTDKGAELEKRLKDGATLDAVASELSLEKQVKRGLKRGADDADLGKDGVAAAFGVAVNGVGVADLPADGSKALFQVAESIDPVASGPDAIPDEQKTQFASGLADDLLDQLVARLNGQFEVRIDQAAIQHALSF